MSSRFEILSNQDKKGIIAHGKDYKEVFENAAFGLFSTMAEISNVKTVEFLNVTASGSEIEELFINWLNELIFLHDSKKLLLKEFVITSLSGKELKAEVKGEKINKGLHMLHKSIKSARFEGMELSPTKGKVFFDE